MPKLFRNPFKGTRSSQKKPSQNAKSKTKSQENTKTQQKQKSSGASKSPKSPKSLKPSGASGSSNLGTPYGYTDMHMPQTIKEVFDLTVQMLQQRKEWDDAIKEAERSDVEARCRAVENELRLQKTIFMKCGFIAHKKKLLNMLYQKVMGDEKTENGEAYETLLEYIKMVNPKLSQYPGPGSHLNLEEWLSSHPFHRALTRARDLAVAQSNKERAIRLEENKKLKERMKERMRAAQN